MTPFEAWVASFPLAVVRESGWAWATLEISHFFGLSLLLGSVGLFDLRLMGLAKGIPPWALHRLVPFGILGFAINLVTGLLFFIAIPVNYVRNPAFQIKLVLIVLAGINVLLFYRMMAAEVRTVAAGGDVPRMAKLIGLLSFCLWVGVLCAGRLVAFYKPGPFF
jgi:hypothetical protein